MSDNPLVEQFDTQEGFYGTALHELTHWSGAEKRLDRKVGNIFGTEQYAAEELVAELGSAFLSAGFGIEVEPHINHAAYLKNWLAALESNPKALYRAAKLAQESTNFLTELVAKTTEEVAV